MGVNAPGLLLGIPNFIPFWFKTVISGLPLSCQFLKLLLSFNNS